MFVVRERFMSEVKRGTKEKLFKEVKGLCFYCGVKLIPEIITWDHIIARDNGGNGTVKNLCACCKGCNAIKGVYSIEKFRDILCKSKGKKEYTFWFEVLRLKKAFSDGK